jgi:hypothetical protein
MGTAGKKLLPMSILSFVRERCVSFFLTNA